jgi:7,8-dihydropterin-6-yl-methyl-4-(beta-D-ribofuranosyl)aminobenzene 5'-phosphate synthase
MKITILYDNAAGAPGFKASHGFSCFIEGLEKRVLFDTGTDGTILLSNMKKAGVNPGDLDSVFLSHHHHDHVGGLSALCRKNPEPEIFVPASFPPEFKRLKELQCSTFTWVRLPEEVCDGALSTGELGRTIREQSLILRKKEGYALVTGCAHPGLLYILKHASELVSETPDLVIGGFHLIGHAESEIRDIAREMRARGVRKIAPCHCTGEKAWEVFQREFGEDFVPAGAGVSLELVS